jgi:hypothetical protein
MLAPSTLKLSLTTALTAVVAVAVAPILLQAVEGAWSRMPQPRPARL